MGIKRAVQLAIAAAAAVALLAYLRDPPWVLSYTHGLHPWENDAEGRRVRWTSGRAAFHVPSDLHSVTIPLRSFKASPSDPPTIALVTMDDRVVDRVTFHDESWRLITIRLPPPGARRARRIDIKLDRVHPRNLGVRLGELEFRR